MHVSRELEKQVFLLAYLSEYYRILSVGVSFDF